MTKDCSTIAAASNEIDFDNNVEYLIILNDIWEGFGVKHGFGSD